MVSALSLPAGGEPTTKSNAEGDSSDPGSQGGVLGIASANHKHLPVALRNTFVTDRQLRPGVYSGHFNCNPHPLVPYKLWELNPRFSIESDSAARKSEYFLW